MMKVKITPAIIVFGLLEMGRVIIDKLRWAPSRPFQVLEYLKKNVPAGDPAATLDAMDEFARKRRFLMNVGDVKGAILKQALTDAGAQSALELGAYCGYSAVLIAAHMGEGSHLDSIEINPDNADASRQVIEHAGLSDRVTVHTGAAREIIPELGQQYDLIFVDHWKDLYLPDLQVAEQSNCLKPGSHVVADNVGMFNAADYLGHVRDCGLYDSTSHDTHMEYQEEVSDAVEISIYRGS